MKTLFTVYLNLKAGLINIFITIIKAFLKNLQTNVTPGFKVFIQCIIFQGVFIQKSVSTNPACSATYCSSTQQIAHKLCGLFSKPDISPVVGREQMQIWKKVNIRLLRTRPHKCTWKKSITLLGQVSNC